MLGRNRQGLRTLSADLIDQASDETAAQVVRLMLAFVGIAAFCLLSPASPDSGLLTSNEKLTVPGAGPVSFFGFYLQIYVEHSARLDRVAQRMPVARAPTFRRAQGAHAAQGAGGCLGDGGSWDQPALAADS
jgi:hypothetical protein